MLSAQQQTHVANNQTNTTRSCNSHLLRSIYIQNKPSTIDHQFLLLVKWKEVCFIHSFYRHHIKIKHFQSVLSSLIYITVCCIYYAVPCRRVLYSAKQQLYYKGRSWQLIIISLVQYEKTDEQHSGAVVYSVISQREGEIFLFSGCMFSPSARVFLSSLWTVTHRNA